MLFAYFEFTAIGLLAIAGCTAAGLAIGKLLFRDDRLLKQFQRECNQLAIELSKHGFKVLPPILNDVAYMDLVDLRKDFRNALHTFMDPKLRAAELAELFEGMVKSKLEDPKQRQTFLDDIVRQAAALGTAPSANARLPVATTPATHSAAAATAPTREAPPAQADAEKPSA